MSEVKKFNDYREKMNERILALDSKVIKRIYNIDTRAYEADALSVKTKELAGLAASMVLRCDDCIRYHIQSSADAGASAKEIVEIFEISLVVGGTIVIPHMRRAVEFLDEVFDKE